MPSQKASRAMQAVPDATNRAVEPVISQGSRVISSEYALLIEAIFCVSSTPNRGYESKFKGAPCNVAGISGLLSNVASSFEGGYQAVTVYGSASLVV